jgi:hypothetical protein
MNRKQRRAPDQVTEQMLAETRTRVLQELERPEVYKAAKALAARIPIRGRLEGKATIHIITIALNAD